MSELFRADSEAEFWGVPGSKIAILPADGDDLVRMSKAAAHLKLAPSAAMPDIEAALREFVRSRAAGLFEYCRISERFTMAEHEIDHVIAVKHGGQTVVENLALCCTVCNRFQGSDIGSIDPETGQLTPLFHPRLDRWDDHYELRDGEILGVTASLTRIKERQLPQG
jgi:hypothetical protein